MPVEDQVAQIYAATNGYLDRIVVGKVEKFLAELTESLRGSESELLGKIAEGEWGDDVQKQLEEAIKQFAEDFGYDLDEEGHPLEDDEESDRERSRSGSGSSDRDGEDDEDDNESSESREKEGAAA